MKNELKTLKDIEGHFTRLNIKVVRCDMLKAEAIKWVKEDIRLDLQILPRTKTWMKRLNITEEDLQ